MILGFFKCVLSELVVFLFKSKSTPLLKQSLVSQAWNLSVALGVSYLFPSFSRDEIALRRSSNFGSWACLVGVMGKGSDPNG